MYIPLEATTVWSISGCRNRSLPSD